MDHDSSATHRILGRVVGGDRESRGALLARHEARLRRMIALRLDPRLRGRIDVGDVIQEVFLAASKGLDSYASRPGVPFFLWLRGIAGNKLLEIHRYHLGTPMRDARREVRLNHGALPEATSAVLAARILGRSTSPSEAAIRAEAKLLLEDSLNGMDPLDREVLTLRHFEHLTNAEAARELGITTAAAGKRYLRALERLREILAHLPGCLEP